MLAVMMTIDVVTPLVAGAYTGVNELVTNRQNSDIKHPQNMYQLDS